MASQPRRQRLVVEDIGDVTVVNFVDKKILDEQNIQMIGDDLFRGVRRFFKCYVSRKGYREGEYGVLIALMAALYPILSNLRARELLRAQSKPPARLIAPTARTPVKLHPATGPRSAVAAKLDNGVGLAH